jgi:prephenate dehydrogenase
MAGREKSGVNFSREVSFKSANYLITTTDNSKQYAIEILKQLGKDLGFGKIHVIDCIKHDNVIGFTSQLTHAIAVSLVNSDKDKDTKFFIGDSYRDLTRIAKINEVLWTELFLENKDNLLKSIEQFEDELDVLKNAIKNDDREKLKELFINSTKVRKGMDK